jgi:lantibiotic biosynthesis protein
MVTTLLKPGSLSDEIETGHWRSLLNGDLRQMAWETVREIATAITSVLLVSGVSPQNPWAEFPKSKIVCWKAEVALFYAYLAKASGDAEFSQLASDYLNEAIVEAAEQACPPHLLGGLTEIAWVMAHLAGTGLGPDLADSCAELDEFLHEQLSQVNRQEHFDLYTGLTGYGVYALERGPEASELAVRVVTRLQQAAEYNAQGITWHTQAAWLPEWLAQLHPQGVYNLGVAHGVPGVIGFLAKENENMSDQKPADQKASKLNRLKVNKETIRDLDIPNAGDVKGGATTIQQQTHNNCGLMDKCPYTFRHPTVA